VAVMKPFTYNYMQGLQNVPAKEDRQLSRPHLIGGNSYESLMSSWWMLIGC